MKSKYIQRVVFVDLADAKSVMVLVSSDFGHKLHAYQQLKSLGMRPNSAAMTEARRDTTETGLLLIAVAAEFKRLHVDCDCGTTDEEISQGIADVVKFVAEIEADTDAAGPVDTNPAHAVEDLQTFLGAVGAAIPPGMFGDAPDTRNARYGDGDGTGLYL